MVADCVRPPERSPAAIPGSRFRTFATANAIASPDTVTVTPSAAQRRPSPFMVAKKRGPTE